MPDCPKSNNPDSMSCTALSKALLTLFGTVLQPDPATTNTAGVVTQEVHMIACGSTGRSKTNTDKHQTPTAAREPVPLFHYHEQSSDRQRAPCVHENRQHLPEVFTPAWPTTQLHMVTDVLQLLLMMCPALNVAVLACD